LSATEIVALSAPAAVGSNVTEIVQEAPAASDPPQLLVSAKAALFVPPTAILPMLSAAFPVLLSLAVFAALLAPVSTEPKSSVAGASVAAGAVAVPVRELVCGEPEALSETLRAAVAEPVPTGANVTEIVQEAPAAREPPQVFDAMENSGALAPSRLID
jgi:hypothetical protein